MKKTTGNILVIFGATGDLASRKIFPALNEIRKSKWKPARQGKEKVGVYLTKTFNFTLEQAN